MKKIILTILFSLSILFILFIVVSLFGNPISKIIVTNKSKEYIKETYSNSDYYIERVFYSFKDGSYHCLILSESSIDSTFYVTYNSVGKLIRDSYDSYVTNKHNTFTRIDEEYRNEIEDVLNKLPYKSDIDFGTIRASDHSSEDILNTGLDTSTLVLDKKYDIYEIGKKYGEIVYYAYDKDVSESKIKEILLKIKKECDSNKVGFYSINLHLYSIEDYDTKKWSKTIDIESFLYSDIKEDDIDEKIHKSIEDTKLYYDNLEKKGY